MTPHILGPAPPGPARYTAGTSEILELWFDGQPVREECLIVDAGKRAGTGVRSYDAGAATKGSEAAGDVGQEGPLRQPDRCGSGP
jgi:hypothetical protein